MCSFYHQGNLLEQPQTLSFNQIHSGQININTSEISSKVRNQDLSQESVLSQVWVGNPQQAICIPANSMKVVQGRTDRITRQLSCMVEARACNNLTRGVVVNRTMFTPNKNKRVPISLVNTNTYNIWICQTLLVANVVEAEDCPWDYQPIMSHDGNDIKVSFCLMPSSEVQAEILSQGVNSMVSDTATLNQHEGGERPKSGPQPNFNDPDFDFKQELSRLPFPVNMGEINMNELQQKQFLELIYDNQSVFSLCDEDLGLCDRLKHTIPTTTDRPIYLPHRTIPVQLQTEVHKCLDTWLRQGIIRPSPILYASQVVIVHKKTGEICLCVDFRALKASLYTIHSLSLKLRRPYKL